MANYLDLLNSIYTKEKKAVNYDIGISIALTKTLAKDKDNLEAIKKCVPFLFYLSPLHYFYMLYFNIPKKTYIPKMLKIENEEITENKLYSKIQYVLGWTNRELKLNEKILDRVIEQETWKKELAVK